MATPRAEAMPPGNGVRGGLERAPHVPKSDASIGPAHRRGAPLSSQPIRLLHPPNLGAAGAEMLDGGPVFGR